MNTDHRRRFTFLVIVTKIAMSSFVSCRSASINCGFMMPESDIILTTVRIHPILAVLLRVY